MPSTAEDVGLGDAVFPPSSDRPMTHPSATSSQSDDVTRFRFANPLPVAVASSAFPFRSATFVPFSRRRFASCVARRFPALTSSVGLFPAPVWVGGGKRRLIFMRIPRSTMVAWWSVVDDIARWLALVRPTRYAVSPVAAAVRRRTQSIKACLRRRSNVILLSAAASARPACPPRTAIDHQATLTDDTAFTRPAITQRDTTKFAPYAG